MRPPFLPHAIPALCIFALGGLSCQATLADSLSINTRSDLLYQRVTGPGQANSFYDTGTHLLHETDLRWQGQAFGNQWNSLFNGTLRVTDSKQFDPEEVSFQKLEWRLNDAHTQLNFGDYFANLSQYSLTKGIKGVGFQRNFQDDQNYLRLTYGTFDGQWAYLYHHPTGEPMDRYGGGARLQRAWDKFRVGLNLAQVADRSDDPNRAVGLDAYSQILPAADWEYRDGGLVLTGEHAYSDTDTKPGAGGATTSKSGSAHKLVMRAAFKSINLDGQAERVAPDFLSLGGGATPDRLRYYLKADYKLTREWRLFGIVDNYRDNLDSQKTATTESTTWEAGLRKSRAFDRRHMNVALSWRVRNLDVSDASRDQVTHRVKLKVNDRIANDFDVRGELEQILDKDHRTSDNAQSTLFDLGIGYRKRLENKWDMRANLDLGRQETGTLNANGTDVSDRVRLSLNADKGNGTVLGCSYEWNDSDLVAATGDNRHKRASAFWQSHPAWLKNGNLKLEYSDFDHLFLQNSGNNYREQILKLSLQWNFQKEAKQ